MWWIYFRKPLFQGVRTILVGNENLSSPFQWSWKPNSIKSIRKINRCWHLYDSERLREERQDFPILFWRRSAVEAALVGWSGIDNMTSTSQDRGQGQAEAIKALLIKSWRERWSDVQFGIQIKSLINRGKKRDTFGNWNHFRSSLGTCGDTFHLSDLILEQALIGPSPNALIIGFLKHSLAAHVSVLGQKFQSVLELQSFLRWWPTRPCSYPSPSLPTLSANLIV